MQKVAEGKKGPPEPKKAAEDPKKGEETKKEPEGPKKGEEAKKVDAKETKKEEPKKEEAPAEAKKDDKPAEKDDKKEADKKDKKKSKKGKGAKLKALISKAQSIFALGIFFHILAISYFKANIVHVLRFQCKMNENQSIVSFHLFQSTAYITAYFFGIIMSYSPLATFILSIIFYLLGGVAVAGALIVMPHHANLMPLIPYALMVFGFGIGTYKCTIPKVLHPAHKSLETFLACMFTEMALEVAIIGLASMFLLNFEIYVFLALYGVSLLVIIIATIDPMNDPKHLSEKAFKYVNVNNCMFYGLWKMAASTTTRLARMSKKKDPADAKHWLYRSEKKFGKALVEALIIKLTLHKFYIWIAGVWIAVEIRYSYWVFVTYLTDRRFAGLVFQPSQFLGLPPLIACLCIPLFAFFLGPALTWSYYNNGTRKMCLGAGFLLFATALSWQASQRLGDVATEFMEPDFQHTHVRILNGHFCPSAVLHYFPVDLEVARVMHPRPAIETAYPEKGGKVNLGLKKDIETMVHMLTPQNDDTYLKYANLPIISEPVGDLEQTTVKPTDSFSYLKKTRSRLDNAVTVQSFGYCPTLARFTLDIPKTLTRKAVDHADVFLLRNDNKSEFVWYKNLNYAKDPMLRPGVRIFVVAGQGTAVDVVLKKNKKQLVKVTGKLPSKMIWLEEGDGKNLEIHAAGKVVRFNHTVRAAEMIELVVNVDRRDVTVKMMYVTAPHLVNGLSVVPQYILATFGEFLVGMVGLQYLIGIAPPKMQYYVYMDWYLMLGFANIAIVVVNLLTPVYHSQLSYLTMIVGISYCFLMVMSSRF